MTDTIRPGSDQDETRKLLVQLADRRWRELRRDHNRLFMSYGSGPEWDRYKAEQANEWREIELLVAYVREHGDEATTRRIP